MIGLELPYVVNCKESDRQNLQTLVAILQKIRLLKIWIFSSKTVAILKVIAKFPSKFSNIRALHIEFTEEYVDDIINIPASFMEHIRDIELVSKTMGGDHSRFVEAADSLIKKTTYLQHLRLIPSKKKIEWIGVLANNADKLRHLDSLSIEAEVPINRVSHDEEPTKRGDLYYQTMKNMVVEDIVQQPVTASDKLAETRAMFENDTTRFLQLP